MDETIFRAMKAATWERAKGELRALVAIKGSQASYRGSPSEDKPFPYQALEAEVDAFIARVEDEGLQE